MRPDPARDNATPRAKKSRSRGGRRPVRFLPACGPGIETLEVRIVMSTDVWTGADPDASPDWSVGANWQSGVAPSAGDTLQFPASASDLSPNNDYAAGTAFASIDVQAPDYDLTGNAVELTGNLVASFTSSSSTYELDTTLDGGVVNVAAGGIFFDTGQVSGSAGLELTGGGGLQLRGSVANNYTGTTTVDNGTLTLDNITSRYAIPGPLVIGGSGTGIVQESNSHQINPNSTLTINTNGTFNVDGGTEVIGALDMSGGARIFTATSDGTLAGLLTIGGDVTVPSGSPTINGVINLGSTDRTFNVAGSLNVYATVQGTHALDKTGVGTLNLQDTYQDAGAVNIDAGVLYFIDGGSIDESSTAGITVASGAAMHSYNMGTINVPVLLSGTGNTGNGALENTEYTTTYSNVTLAANTTIGSDSNSELYFSGAVGDGGSGYSLRKVGTGWLFLGGVNTYTGGTVVSAGLLYVTGTTLGNVSTTTGGQLGGKGTVGNVSTAGGVVDAGGLSNTDIETEHDSSLTLDSTATFAAELNGASSYDKVIVAGAVALNNATLSLPTYNYTPGAGDSLDIIQGATSLTGTFNNLPEGSLLTEAGDSFRITYVGGAGGHDVILNRVVTSTTTVTYPSASAVYGQPVTFSATIGSPQGGTPTGTVTFFLGTTDLGSGTLSGTTATITTAVLPVANDVVTAVYNGDIHSLTSNSDAQPVTQQVFKDNTSAAVVTSVTPSVSGQAVTFTTTVTPTSPGGGTPDGSVIFYDGTTQLATVTLASAQATFSTSSLTPGTHNISVAYSGSGNYYLSNSTQTVETVNQSATTATAPTSTGSTTYGQSVTFSTTVAATSPGSGTPTGTVTFYDGSTSIGTGTLDGSGDASLVISTLGAGSHSITAVYGGDGDFTTSTSSSTTQAVSQTSTTTALTTSDADVSYGQPVTFTATTSAVAPGGGTPTGTVTFYDGSTSIGTGTLDSSGVATLITGSLGFGPHSITAAYGGDSNFTTSTSSTTGESIELATATIAVAPAANPAVFGEPITLGATLTPPFAGAGTPTGMVTFYNGETQLGTATLASGSASITLPPFALGSYSITVTYTGDSNYQGGTSPATTLQVDQSASTETVSPPTAVVFGQSATLSLTVAATAPGAGTPTGTVTFYDGSTPIGSGTLDGSGSDTISVSGLAAGPHSITASYSGDGDFLATTSPSTVLTIDKSATSDSVAPPTPTTFGQSATLSLTVAATSPGSGTPTGTVTFYDGANPIGSATLVSGVATYSTTSFAAGSHAITAVYIGDSNFLTSTSASTTLVVGQSGSSATMTPPVSVVSGQSAPLSATLQAVGGAGTPTGTVTFYEGTTMLGVGTLNGSGTATINVTGLSVGSHSITATYAGDANFTGSTSSTAPLTVNRSASAATVAPTTSVVFGQPATLSVTLAAVAPGSGTPTGTVTFYDGTTAIGTATLDDSGTASIVDANFSVGSHSITATYSGDADFFESSASAVTLLVGQSSSSATLTPPISVVFGGSATLSLTVAAASPGAGTPTGNVTFFDGSTGLGMVALDGSGTATITVPGLGVGGHSITASYAGDQDFLASVAPATNLNVASEPTTALMTPAGPSTTFGQSVTFSVGVASNDPEDVSPTGLVTFYDGSTVIGTATLDGSDLASITIATLDAGTHSITASYAGDSNFAASTTSAISQAVVPSGTTLAVTSSANPSVFGQSTTFAVTVSAVAPGAGTPTGTVRFFDGETEIGSATLDETGSAAIAVSSLDAADHSITAVYSGDSNFDGDTSPAMAQAVNTAGSTVSLVSSDPSRTYGQEITFTTTVSAVAPGAGVPTGVVTFLDGTTPIGTATLDGNGSASITLSSLDAGSLPITVSYPGDVSFSGSTSSAVTEGVSAAGTTTALALAGNAAVYGQPETLVATVAIVAPGIGTPAGTVDFFDGSTLLGSASLVDGVATFQTGGVDVGSRSLTASFVGGVDFTASASPAMNQIVAPDQTLTVVHGGGSTDFGQASTYTATVTPVAPGTGIPTGLVLFEDGLVPIAAAYLDAEGVATITTEVLGIGSHAVTAVYAGDGHYALSTATPVAASVVQSSTVVDVSQPGLIALGQPATLSLTVGVVAPGSGTPTGSVTFYDGTTALDTETLVAGTATITVPSLDGGDHAITATYSGDANYAGATSAPSTLTVARQGTAAVVVTPSSLTYGDPATFSITIPTTPGAETPTGTVTYYDGTTAIGTATLDAHGTATLDLPIPGGGSHAITGLYSGDVNYQPSTSPVTTVMVAKLGTTATIDAPTSTTYGQPATLSVTIPAVTGGATPTGTVAYYDGTTPIGTATLDAHGTATFSLADLGAGTHAISVRYSGDANYQAINLEPSTLTVAKLDTTGTVEVPPSTVAGQPTVLSLTIPSTPGEAEPTGTVTYYDGTTPIGTVTLDSSGTANFTVPALDAGSHSITASYSGDANYQAVTSGATTLPVGQAASTLSVALPTSIVSGGTAAITATVAVVAPGSGTPTGTVTFYDGQAFLGTVALADGSATLSASALGAGPHDITASYSGDANNSPSSSAAIPTTVQSMISGTVYLDDNANGNPDAGEPAAGGRVVYLDLNHDGSLDSGDPTATTDTNGDFSFPGYAVGTYSVLEATGQDASDRYVVDQILANADGSLSIGLVPISPVAPVPVIPNPFTASTTTDPNSAYVESLYRAVLGRDGEASGVAGWVAEMNGGATRLQVAEGFVNSPEHRQDEVVAYYKEFLHRAPDPGSQHWVDELLAGVSEEAVVEGILDSPEYQAAHQDSATFINDLYTDVLGRQADSSGASAWQSALASGTSRATIVAGFVQSTEAIDQVVDSFYTAFLHRQPEQPTSQSWVTMLEAPDGSATDVAAGILADPEFDQDAANAGSY